MRDLLDLRILEHRDVEICRLFRLIIEPQHWSNFLHASWCAQRDAVQILALAIQIWGLDLVLGRTAGGVIGMMVRAGLALLVGTRRFAVTNCDFTFALSVRRFPSAPSPLGVSAKKSST
jgi:hypothetical protein